jgi:hypothetical protein
MDTTQTQYMSALDWLKSLALIDVAIGGARLTDRSASVLPANTGQLLLEAALEHSRPPWLLDADSLVTTVGDLPTDVLSAAAVLEIADPAVLTSVRRVHGKIDLKERSRVGSAGEGVLIEALEESWPGSTVHIAAANDGFGYDVAFRLDDVEWHLELKATTRKGRLKIYLSRNEFEIGQQDALWRLVVLGLGEDLKLRAIATVKPGTIAPRVPLDRSSRSTWQSVAFELTPPDLVPGLVLGPGRSSLLNASVFQDRTFLWLP